MSRHYDNGLEFLREFHRSDPGCTARELARGRDANGHSSYQRLASVVPRAAAGITVLDLACGDGYLLERIAERDVPASALIGVDMASEELDLARQRPLLANARLLCQRADELSLADASVDYAVSHFALDLMDDIGPALSQLARVLRPGGTFSTVVGGAGTLAGAGANAFELFMNLFWQTAEREDTLPIRFGDERASTPDGWRDMLSTADAFADDVAIDEFELILHGQLDQVWSLLATGYLMPFLAPEARASVEREFRAAAPELALPDGNIPMTLSSMQITARRAT